jgi:hypothetical protein
MDCGPCAPPERPMRLGRFLSARVALATDRCFLLRYCRNPRLLYRPPALEVQGGPIAGRRASASVRCTRPAAGPSCGYDRPADGGNSHRTDARCAECRVCVRKCPRGALARSWPGSRPRASRRRASSLPRERACSRPGSLTAHWRRHRPSPAPVDGQGPATHAVPAPSPLSTPGSGVGAPEASAERGPLA